MPWESRNYENANQAVYDTLVGIRAEAEQTNNLLQLILQQLRMQPVPVADRTEGE